MGRSLSVVNTSVTNDPVYVTAAESIAANSLVTYNANNQITGLDTKSTVTVRGPKLVTSSVDTTLRVRNSDTTNATLSTDVLTNGNIVVGYANASNSSRASFAILSPTGTVVVAPVQLSAGTPYIIKVQSLSGGGFAVAYMNGDGTMIGVYQNDGTQVLAPTQISATSVNGTMGLRMCRAMTDGTGFAVLWSESGSTVLRVYNASGAQQATTTIGTLALAAIMYGQDNRFDIIRHPANGNLYVAAYNGQTTTGSPQAFVGVWSYHPQTLNSVNTASGFTTSIQSAIEAFTGITIIPATNGLTVFAGFRRPFNNSGTAANFVQSFGLTLGSSDQVPICFGDGGWKSTSYNYGDTGANGRAILDHATGESCYLSCENSRARLLHFTPGSAFAFERDQASAASAEAVNATICGSGTSLYYVYPSGYTSPANIMFGVYSTATEVIEKTANYSGLGLTAGQTSGTYSFPSSIHGAMLAGLDSTVLTVNSHRVSTDIGGARYFTTHSCTSSHNSSYWPSKHQHSAAIVVCHADGTSAYTTHLLPRNMGYGTRGESNYPYASYYPQIQSVNGYLVNLSIERDSSISVVYATIIKLSDWTIAQRTAVSRQTGTQLSQYDSLVVGSNGLYIASNENSVLCDRFGQIDSNGNYSSSRAQTGNGLTNPGNVSACLTKDRFGAVMLSGPGSPNGSLAFIIRDTPTFATTSVNTESSIGSISTGNYNYTRLLPRSPTTFWLISVNGTNAYFGVLGSLSGQTMNGIGVSSVSNYVVIRDKPTPDWGTSFAMLDSSTVLRFFRWSNVTSSSALSGTRTVSSGNLYGGGFSADGSVVFSDASQQGFATASGDTPLIAGVITSAATANQTATVARTGVYQLNKSYPPVSFNFKRGSPPGSKGQIMGSTAILDSSKTNIA